MCAADSSVLNSQIFDCSGSHTTKQSGRRVSYNAASDIKIEDGLIVSIKCSLKTSRRGSADATYRRPRFVSQVDVVYKFHGLAGEVICLVIYLLGYPGELGCVMDCIHAVNFCDFGDRSAIPIGYVAAESRVNFYIKLG